MYISGFPISLLEMGGALLPPMGGAPGVVGGSALRRVGDRSILVHVQRVGGSVYISACAHIGTYNFCTVTGCFFECLCVSPSVQRGGGGRHHKMYGRGKWGDFQ